MRKAAAFLAGLLTVAPAFAYELPDVLRQMQAKQNMLDAIQFNFTQNVEFTTAGTKEIVKGNAVFAKQGKLRVVRSKPDEQIMVSDGKKVSIYNPAFNQVWVGAWTNWANASYIPKGFLPMTDFVKDLQADFDLTVLSDDGKTVFIEARPRDKNIEYKLELAVATDTWLLNKTTYLSDSAVIVTTLSDIQLNPPTATSLFKFEVPKGTDVISLN